MSGEFQSFLHQRAERDARYIKLFGELAGKYDLYDEIKHEIILGDRSPQETVTIASNDLYLTATTGLSMAGEAAKHLEREHPELKDKPRYKDFPWKSLKVLRDFYSHPCRHLYDDHMRPREEKNLLKAADTLRTYIRQHPNEYRALVLNAGEYAQHIDEGIRFFDALIMWCKAFPPNSAIPMEKSVQMLRAARHASADDDDEDPLFEATVFDNYQRGILNYLSDAAHTTSIFAQQGPQAAFPKETLRPFTRFRDYFAHFDDLDDDGIEEHEDMDDDDPDALLLRNGDRHIDTVMRTMTRRLPEWNDVAATTANLETRYQSMILRPGLNEETPDKNKIAVMDRGVTWIAAHARIDLKPGMAQDTAVENAFVAALGHLLQYTTPTHANELLDFLDRDSKTHFKDIRKPRQILERCPDDLKHVMNAFVEDMEAHFPAKETARKKAQRDF